MHTWFLFFIKGITEHFTTFYLPLSCTIYYCYYYNILREIIVEYPFILRYHLLRVMNEIIMFTGSTPSQIQVC